MDAEREIARLYALEYGEPRELAFRFAAIFLGAVILYFYTGWSFSFLWLGFYALAHAVHFAFLRTRGPEVTQTDVTIAGMLFLVILAAFLWVPWLLILQDDLALEISGSTALASVLIFLVRRSDTPRFMVIGEIAIVALAVLAALVVTVPRIDAPIAQFAMIFCAVGMVGYVAHAILLNRKIRLESEETERQLRHAQKLRTLGQLTGGVAHDFNNLLAVIQGNAEVLADAHGADAPGVAAILRATDRGAALTRRLLAFSRQQPLAPETLNLGELAPGIAGLLRRTLGETISVEVHVAEALWPVRIDRAQFETAIVDLAINARDAMPGGGRLTLEFANTWLAAPQVSETGTVPAGHHVVVAVSDAGEGMSDVVRRRAVEPFFTTRPPARNNGLGLSMVHGFVHQSGGGLRIDSAPGAGTTVRLYFPRAQGVVQTAPEGADPSPRGQGQCILVVEDDAEVQRFLETALGGLGYRVRSAGDVPEALAIARSLERLDLVLSDVVLPGGMDGVDGARALRALHPGAALVFMSGYPARDAADLAGRGAVPVLLSKPFRVEVLARAIAEALRGVPGAG
ncbi:MAG: response regulator [Rhodovulum sp.]